MFHRATDASKCALVGLADLVFADRDPLRTIDVQWATPHLASLGVSEIPRSDYLVRLERSLALSVPSSFDS
jgi:leucyl/phenylalanyl-tRNA--protein transferase